MERKEGVGRYLVATRDIQPMGEMGNQLISITYIYRVTLVVIVWVALTWIVQPRSTSRWDILFFGSSLSDL